MPRGIVELPLSRGLVAIVDADDPLEPWSWKWYAHSGGHCIFYAARRAYSDGKGALIYLHRFLLDAPEGLQVDHVNHNGLDNRRANLRLATPSRNTQNQSGLLSTNTSGYRGVFRYKLVGRWRAGIRLDGSTRHLGYFDTPEEAARTFDRAAVEMFGEFAGYLNFPDELIGVEREVEIKS